MASVVCSNTWEIVKLDGSSSRTNEILLLYQGLNPCTMRITNTSKELVFVITEETGKKGTGHELSLWPNNSIIIESKSIQVGVSNSAGTLPLKGTLDILSFQN